MCWVVKHKSGTVLFRTDNIETARDRKRAGWRIEMDKSREQFEEWFMSDVVESEVEFPSYEDGEYTQGHIYELEFYLTLQSMWMAWQASRMTLLEKNNAN